MVQFLFRSPVFPVLIETDQRVIGICDKKKVDVISHNKLFEKKDSYTVVDSSGEGWSYVPMQNVISPLTLNKRWYKKNIIEFFNSSLEKNGINTRYRARSLSAKRLSIVVEEIVELSNEL